MTRVDVKLFLARQQNKTLVYCVTPARRPPVCEFPLLFVCERCQVLLVLIGVLFSMCFEYLQPRGSDPGTITYSVFYNTISSTTKDPLREFQVFCSPLRGLFNLDVPQHKSTMTEFLSSLLMIRQKNYSLTPAATFA
jgi:hypothetical protein